MLVTCSLPPKGAVVVWSIHQFRHYIGSAAFTIITDHEFLLGLHGMSIDKDPTRRRARWILELDPFNWVIQHKDGQRHTNADALSRRPQDPEPGMVNDNSQEETTPSVPQTDTLLYQPPTVNPQVTRSFQRVATDIVELPVTSRGNRHVLVVEDHFTKFVNLYALPNQTPSQ